VGFGECAPLPEAGTEPQDRAAAGLEDLLPDLAGRSADDVFDMLPGPTILPAVRCALETALLDLVARTAGCPAAASLNPAAAGNVAVNAMIGSLDTDPEPRADRALAAGYRVLKIKLGVMPPEQEHAALIGLAETLPSQIRLRLDANRAWDEDTARQMIAALSGLPIDGLEEPLQRAEPHALGRLQNLAPWPIALDESLSHDALPGLLEAPPVRRLVLKPMVIGGPLTVLDVAARARDAGLEVVITTTLDAAVGTAAALHTAAALASDATHGLATSDWLAEDVGRPPQIERGRMAVGGEPGLGVTPFESIRFEETANA
jgi:o-succinylbenzoate synthase